MTLYSKRDVILVPFPFSDLSYTKKRPALVLAVIPEHDEIICMMLTSSRLIDQRFDVPIINLDIAGLPKQTVARVSRLFTLDTSIINKRIGSLDITEFDSIVDKMIKLIRL